MKKLVPFLLFLGMSQLVVGQISQCGHQHLLDHRGAEYEQLVDQTYEKARSQINRSSSRSNELLTVPVVVHILHNTPEQNIPDSAVFSQIEVLNEDFQRMNANAGETRDIFKDVAGTPNIQFVLADTDPDGNPTTGITRTQTDVKSFAPLNITLADLQAAADSCNINLANQQELLDSFFCFDIYSLLIGLEKLDKQSLLELEEMKFSSKGGIDAWDPDRYINIWVCNLTFTVNNMDAIGLYGFATPPVEAPNWEIFEFPEDYEELDGLVINYLAFGRNTPVVSQAGITGGRITTHEMGHYFGLRHVSGDGYCENDDGLADTPSADALIPPKSIEELTIVKSCAEEQLTDTCPDDELPDMIENYMDYSPNVCQNMFTLEQTSIMRSMLEGPRAGLILENITSTFSEELDQAVRLYPNPTSGLLQLEMEGFDKEDFNVIIENVVGQQCLIQAASVPLYLGQLEKGLYWVRLRSDKIEVVKKVVVE